MRKRVVGFTIVLAATTVAASPADTGWPAAPLAGSCQIAAPDDAHPLGNRAEALAQYEQLSPACLKALVLACNEAADRVLLDLGSAAVCSIGYEALLKRGFGGNFQALVAWWRSRHAEPSY